MILEIKVKSVTRRDAALDNVARFVKRTETYWSLHRGRVGTPKHTQILHPGLDARDLKSHTPSTNTIYCHDPVSRRMRPLVAIDSGVQQRSWRFGFDLDDAMTKMTKMTQV